MEYDKISDFYTCKNNRKLTVSHIRHNKTKTGYVSEKTIYTCENCSDCPYKSDCIKGNNCKTPLGERTKVLQVAKTFIKHRKEDLERIISDEGESVSSGCSLVSITLTPFWPKTVMNLL